jgi:hypothetical protein
MQSLKVDRDRSLGARFTWKLSSPPIPFASVGGLVSYKHAGNSDPPIGLTLLDVEKYLEVSYALLAHEVGMYGAFKALKEYSQHKAT